MQDIVIDDVAAVPTLPALFSDFSTVVLLDLCTSWLGLETILKKNYMLTQ